MCCMWVMSSSRSSTSLARGVFRHRMSCRLPPGAYWSRRFTHGVGPPYRLLVLAGGEQEQIPFTGELEQRLIDAVAEMCELVFTGIEPGRRWVAPKRRACPSFNCQKNSCSAGRRRLPKTLCSAGRRRLPKTLCTAGRCRPPKRLRLQSSRNSRRRSLPAALRGNVSLNSTRRGTL
jgi:hypothetical protein